MSRGISLTPVLKRTRRRTKSSVRLRTTNTVARSTRFFTASVIITVPPLPRCLLRSGTAQSAVWAVYALFHRPTLNTGHSGARLRTTVYAANAIEEVILREGADTVGGLILELNCGRRCHRAAQGILGSGSEICKKYDILLIIDEVVCGMGEPVLGSAINITALSLTSSPCQRLPPVTQQSLHCDDRGGVR